MRTSPLRSTFVVLLVTAPLRAQTVCHAENDGPGFNDTVALSTPLVAIEFTPATSISVNRIEVFTGEVTGTSSVAIWTHDSVNDQPGAPLASGSWSMTLPNAFQGADLSSAAPLAGGSVYWVVLTPVGGAQANVDVPMTTLGQVYRVSFDGGTIWNGPYQFTYRHWKFRLSCISPATAGCFGDGSLPTACPCGNTGASGRGCENSATTGGAALSATGSTSPDTIVLTSSGELPTVLTIFIQGDAIASSGLVFGDGVRCVAGILKRLYVKNASAGTASAPGSGDPSIATQSANLGDPIAPGSTRYYQAYYRDPNLAFCPNPPGNSWNVSSGVSIVW